MIRFAVKLQCTLRGQTNAAIKLPIGEHVLHVQVGDVKLDTPEITVAKGESVAIKVERVGNRVRVMRDGEFLVAKELPKGKAGGGTNSVAKKGGLLTSKYALEFTANASHVGMESMPQLESTECTIEMWVTPTGNPTGSAYLWHNVQGELSIQSTSQYRFYTYHGNAISEPIYQPGQRVHLAGVNDTRRRLLFLNGKLIASTDDAGGLDSEAKPQPMMMGGGAFAGQIESVRVSKIARYTKDYLPPTTFAADKNTTALYLIDEGSGDVLKDSSGTTITARSSGRSG